ncbi:MAG: hypothetical protein NC203_06020 [Firmicutes bacterium]|nr:hypothetical protein [[Eubacterium] siraeum]MCM1487907.1 hypothetical protein [Bacillota bacterium]
MEERNYNLPQEHEICVCCGKGIEEEQAVYCPDCGAPMHRSCWQENGGCGLKDKHGNGFAWQPPAEAPPVPPIQNGAAAYGQQGQYGQNPYGQNPYGQNPYGQNPNGQNPYGQNPYGQNPYGQNPYGQNPNGQNPYGQNPYGQNPYGQNPYGQNPNGQNPYGQNPYNRNTYGQDPYNQSPYGQNREQNDENYPFGGFFTGRNEFPKKSDEEIEKEYSEKKYMGVSQREMMCFMNVNGPASLYRMSLFKYMAEHGKKMSVNFFAGCLSPFNQFYKGMIPLGLLIMAVNFITSLPQLIFLYLSYFNPDRLESFMTNAMSNTISTMAFIQWCLVILLCFFGDYLYLLFMTKKIKKLRARYSDETSEEYLNALAAAGKPRMSKVAICFGIYIVLCLLAMVIMAAIGL